jgi:hypothetical protein
MAELTDIRESVREKYAAATRAAGDAQTAQAKAGYCASSGGGRSPADATGVFGSVLYDEVADAEIPESAT